jgi:IS30 family transposase
VFTLDPVKKKRLNFSDNESQEVWRRWKLGQSLSEIGRELERQAATIHAHIEAEGGYAPAVRKRRQVGLTMDEREEISRALAAGSSLREIAAALGRAPSTISREVKKNGGRTRYRATFADRRAWKQSVRPKICKLAKNAHLRRLVARKLQLDWSPEQIAGWLRIEYSDDHVMTISTETIYRSLFVQTRGVLKQELRSHLRSRRRMRKSRTSTTAGQTRGQIIDAVSISERPAEAEDRAVPGHWEGDLISGSGNSHIATLVERHSRFTMLVKVNGKDAASVASALSREVKKLPMHLRRSLTWDRGSEMAYHAQFTMATKLSVYFCDPRSPWQRGTNENTNRLLRQYFPKGVELSKFSQSQLNGVARQLNQRPRKTLQFKTPAASFSVALTG